jgi:hypothetical protein
MIGGGGGPGVYLINYGCLLEKISHFVVVKTQVLATYSLHYSFELVFYIIKLCELSMW